MNKTLFVVLLGVGLGCGIAASAQPPTRGAISKANEKDLRQAAEGLVPNPEQATPRWRLTVLDAAATVRIECNGRQVVPSAVLPGKAFVNLDSCFQQGRRNSLAIENVGSAGSRAAGYVVERQGRLATTSDGKAASRDCARDACSGAARAELSFDD